MANNEKVGKNKLELEKQYSHKEIESKIYNFWEMNQLFTADIDSNKETYTIVMPPPNITGNLHIGHALDLTIQDIIIRFKRMNGFETLFLPGTDHASIATEVKVVQNLKKLGMDKKDFSREEFLEKAWEWKKEYGSLITNQIRKLGISCDWSRECFTMDKSYEKSVITFFVELYNRNLIYRGKKIINWCPNCKTTLSDAEVDYKQVDTDYIYTLKYNFSSKKNDEKIGELDFLSVSTTRPETIFGDIAVAVNPDDIRYKKYIGKFVRVPIINRKILVLADEFVDSEFGTGVLKVTPAHSYEDFEIGKKNNLEVIMAIDENGFTTDVCGEFKSLKSFDARTKVVEKLDTLGLMTDKKQISHNVGFCYRCNNVIEPLVSTQWFVNMKPLSENSINVVKDKQIKFIPKRFEDVHFRWMNNIRDWCISRQLWWGHRIPAFYCQDCSKITVSSEAPIECSYCKSTKIEQDSDTLDTWFSSALWPFASLGWPNINKNEYKKFFPTTTLVTGYDIIFFWVSRMIFSSLELTKKVPFKNVLIHGLVRDSLGQKMSKSSGNGVDPLKIIEEQGADALRFTLINGLSPGNDTKFYDEKLDGSRNFLNKLWNCTRFLHMNLIKYNYLVKEANKYELENLNLNELMPHNIWILSKLNNLIDEITVNFEKFELGISLQKNYNFFWNDFCDWYLEFIKFDFMQENDELRIQTFEVSLCVFFSLLKIFHPYVPFITEKIWSIFFNNDIKNDISIIKEKFPKKVDIIKENEHENGINTLINIITNIRVWRNENKIPAGKLIFGFVLETLSIKEILLKYKEAIKRFARIEFGFSSKEDIDKFKEDKKFNLIILNCIEVYVDVDEHIDSKKSSLFLKIKIEEINKQLEKYNLNLSNKIFLEKAPKKIIDKTYENIEKLNKKLLSLIKKDK